MKKRNNKNVESYKRKEFIKSEKKGWEKSKTSAIEKLNDEVEKLNEDIKYNEKCYKATVTVIKEAHEIKMEKYQKEKEKLKTSRMLSAKLLKISIDNEIEISFLKKHNLVLHIIIVATFILQVAALILR